MENTTRTIYGSLLQTAMLLGVPHRILEKSTLNERFDILPTTKPANTDVPRMRYFGIGGGGHKFRITASGKAVPDPIQHVALNGSLYDPTPFVLREPAADLSPAQRERYALRKEVIVNGLTYIAYYLRRINMDGVQIAAEIKTVDGVTITVEPFVPDNSNLNPVPPPLETTGTNVIDGRYASATAKIVLDFDKADIDELLNVARIIDGEEEAAIISEIAMVSAVDHVIQVTSPITGTFNFNEVIGAQVVSFINAFYPAKFAKNVIAANIDVGAAEPLFRLTATP